MYLPGILVVLVFLFVGFSCCCFFYSVSIVLYLLFSFLIVSRILICFLSITKSLFLIVLLFFKQNKPCGELEEKMFFPPLTFGDVEPNEKPFAGLEIAREIKKPT